MVWFKVDDTLAAHPKPRQAGLPAIGLWSVAGSWCSQQLTDGHVPTWYVDTWPGGRKHAGALVRAGLWHAPGHTCPDCPQIAEGWIFHDYHQANPTRDQVLAERAAAAERQRKAREAARQKAGRNGVSHAVTGAVTHAEVTADVPRESDRESRGSHGVSHGPPDPTRPDLPGGGVWSETPDRARTPYPTNPPTPTTPNPENHPNRATTTRTGTARRVRCPGHAYLDPDDPGPPCHDCKQARLAADEQDRQAQADARQAIRACRYCDADGRRLDLLGQRSTATRCDHTPYRPEPEPDGANELAAVRAQAQAIPCPTCTAGTGDPCVTDDGQLLPRAPAHAARIAAARKAPAA